MYVLFTKGARGKMKTVQWRHSRKKILDQILREKDFLGYPEYQFDQMCQADNPALSGYVNNTVLQEGLSVHSVEGKDLRDGFSSTTIKPSLRIMLVLDGLTSVAFDDNWVILDAGFTRKEVTPQGMVVGLSQPAKFERHWQKDKFERKVTIHISFDWLSANGFVKDKMPETMADFLQEKVAFKEWQPTQLAISYAEKIFESIRDESTGMGRVSLLCSTLGIIQDALAVFLDADMDKDKLSLAPAKYQDIHKVRAFLDDPDYFHVSAAEIAKIVGLSQSTLQRHFRAMFGSTLDEYRREARLVYARDLLEKEGLSVAEVAKKVGYNSAANFSTAFKRRFGQLPKLFRSRVVC